MKNFENKNKSEQAPIFPDNLSAEDGQLIIKQCELQNATSREQIEGFARAYSKAKDLALDLKRLSNLSAGEVENLIFELGSMIENKNTNGYRKIPVTFRTGNRGLDADKIQQAIKSFCEGYVSFLNDPTEDDRFNAVLLYKEFEKIHPFEDGNGRLGDLLWKILITRRDGEWPEQLPPDVFNE